MNKTEELWISIAEQTLKAGLQKGRIYVLAEELPKGLIPDDKVVEIEIRLVSKSKLENRAE